MTARWSTFDLVIHRRSLSKRQSALHPATAQGGLGATVTMKIDRRALLIAGCSTILAAAGSADARDLPRDVDAKLRAIEAQSKGRLGVCLLDPARHVRIGYRMNERFLMCSTFKLLVGGLILHRVDLGRERLDRRIVYDKGALVPYSPVTGDHAAGQGLSIAALCEAMITLSDNGAANLLLASISKTNDRMRPFPLRCDERSLKTIFRKWNGYKLHSR